MLKSDLKEFPEISHHAFQHHLDSQAMATLQTVPGLSKVIKLFSEHGVERFARLENISHNLHVKADQYPSLYRQYVRMAQVLDVRKLPDLYISTTNEINAYAMGMENYTIVLCSGLIDIMDERELLAILGHELGHVKCDHQLYKTMAHILTRFGSALISQAFPIVGNLLSTGLQLALLDWNRKAEFSCDRAALLAVQDADVVAHTLAKLGGYSQRFDGEINLAAVEAQADQYHEIGMDSLLMKMLKLHSLMGQTHPYPVVRVKEIRRWAKSMEYEQILTGQYQKQRALHAANDWRDVKLSTPRGRCCPNPKCLHPCDENCLFCPSCNSNVRNGQLICGKCRHAVESDWAVCMECGNRLAAHAPAGLLQS